ncbi:MAG: tRNA adenosine(34) deaminase TadA [Snodgrassella alvi]|nr:tRNA adenosine(34) deaminase TadA [Snodgrassella alvi]
MNTLMTTPPLPHKTITFLKQINIHNVEDLRRRGPITTFLQLRNISTGTTERVLWQLIALAENCNVQSIGTEEKEYWRQQLKQHPPVAIFPAKENMEFWMRHALMAAHQAQLLDEVPVGAVVVYKNNIIGLGYNRCITDHNVSHHAEIQALTEASQKQKNYRLQECDVYVTLEPCAMCASALIQARVHRVIYGAAEPKTGAAGSVVDLFADRRLNQHTAILGGIMESESRQILQQFFCKRRSSSLSTEDNSI